LPRPLRGRSDRVGSFEVEHHQAEEGRYRRQARESLHQVHQGNHGRGESGGWGSGKQPQADNIDRAVKKGTGELPGVSYEEVTYEGYGPGGIAILIDALTDNRNRTTGEIRHILTKSGGRMAEAGSVQWMFHQKGAISIPKSAADEETVLNVVLDAGAEDASTDDPEVYEITTSPQAFEAVKAALQAKNIATQSAELAKVPQTTITLSEKDAEQALKLMEALEDNDDVQRVSSNLDIADEVLARIQA